MRALICLTLVVGLVAGVVLGLWLDGGSGAQTAASVLGPPAGTGTGFYFTQRTK